MTLLFLWIVGSDFMARRLSCPAGPRRGASSYGRAPASDGHLARSYILSFSAVNFDVAYDISPLKLASVLHWLWVVGLEGTTSAVGQYLTVSPSEPRGVTSYRITLYC